ncbi:MAG: hypothetical protein ACRDF4_06155, partial [Rhabdochlamydiaceae bacterium]
ALGHIDQIDPTLHLINHQLQEFTNCDTPPKKGPITQEQQHMSYLCRRQIREVANQMRRTTEKLVQNTVSGVFEKIKMLRLLYPFIDTLEQIAMDCCQSHLPWSCCTYPLLEQIETWNSFGLPSK